MKKQILILVTLGLISAGCQTEKNNTISTTTEEHEQPCIGETCELPPENGKEGSKSLTANPVKKQGTSTIQGQKSKQLWAKSFLWAKSPEIVVEKWIGKKPDLTKNKIIILEFWNTWCPPCRRSLPKLTEFQQKFKDDIIVIALTSDGEEEILASEKKHGIKLPDCYIASSPNKETQNEYGVRGVPHVVVIEPENGCVIWEGFPQQEGFELTETILQKIIEIGKQ